MSAVYKITIHAGPTKASLGKLFNIAEYKVNLTRERATSVGHAGDTWGRAGFAALTCDIATRGAVNKQSNNVFSHLADSDTRLCPHTNILVASILFRCGIGK